MKKIKLYPLLSAAYLVLTFFAGNLFSASSRELPSGIHDVTERIEFRL